MPLHFISSQKGKPLLVHKKYIYQHHRVCKAHVTWRCVEYHRQNKCRATITTTSETKTGTVLTVKEHNHAADCAAVNARKVIQKLKKHAEKSAESTRKIITASIASTSAATAAQLPSVSGLARTVQRVRATINPQLPTPSTRGELELTEIFTKTLKGDNFLHYDAGGDKNRFLIFATEQNLQCLAQCTNWYCDGTFRSVPSIFLQLYTIHGMVDGKTIPFVYILAPNKKSKLYASVLAHLKETEPRLNPEVIVSDFEQSFITAAQKNFPKAIIRGCHFHFGQCVYRHVQQCGLQHRYSTDDELALNIKMLIALAFVPAENVHTAFDALTASKYYKTHSEDLKGIVEYFENTWVGARLRRRLRAPLFPIEIWNCYSAVVNDEPRTNNAVEGWHHAFNGRVEKTHAVMGKFITAIKEEQATTELLWEQHVAHRPIATRKRKTYRDLDERLKMVVADFNVNGDFVDYLKGVAHNIKI